MATSTSDRYEAARKALADFDANEEAYHELPDGEQEGRNYERYEDSKLDAADSLADALRAIIEPAATLEPPEQIAERILYSEPVSHDRTLTEWRRKIAEGVQAGIQAAWNSWEPETAPCQITDTEPTAVPFTYDIRDAAGALVATYKVTHLAPVPDVRDFYMITEHQVGRYGQRLDVTRRRTLNQEHFDAIKASIRKD